MSSPFRFGQRAEKKSVWLTLHRTQRYKLPFLPRLPGREPTQKTTRVRFVQTPLDVGRVFASSWHPRHCRLAGSTPPNKIRLPETPIM